MALSARYSDLDGASVFITGGGSGIGAALTEGFLQQGAKVAFVQRSDATAFADQMGETYGNRPHYMQCDITDIARLKACIDEACERHGPLSVLVNNAANDKRHETMEVDEDFFDWSIAINLKSYFFACQAAVPYMREAGGGSIINFSSISYMIGKTGMPIYTMSNAAITSMSTTLAHEFGADKIRINSLAPGWVLTQKQKDLWVTEEGLAEHLKSQALKETLDEADMVGGVLFLASQASRMMSGQSLVIDGGVVVPC
ncbi:MAG: SDR family oxidoreductase [Devosiaceae bacterium]|nr:SDR family oxidoreductase [Devosiaceae bacterium MH13]